MKRLFGYALMLTILTAPAFAAKNSQSVDLSENVKVGSTQLSAGQYKVTWTGTGSNVQVTLAQSGKATVTVAATVVEEKHDHKGFTVNRIGGVDQLEGIQLSNISLVFTSPAVSGQ